MYDDAKPNLHTFIELKKDHPQTKFYAWHVSLEGDANEYMREEIIDERKKRKKKSKLRWAAYGPGPYGLYGVNTGYSGDGGVSGDGGGVGENFADGKNPGRKGLSKRVGIPKKSTLGQLEKIASSSTGERRRMAQWQLNMRRGKKK